MDTRPNKYTRALVRPPGASFVDAICSVRVPIDTELARRQHTEYVAALGEAGISVTALEADERYPDSCFMQDPAFVAAGVAILNRMGAPSRAGEPELLAEVLRKQFDTFRLAEPGTLEGGDVLNLGDRLLVGETARTNREGITHLRAIVEPLGLPVESIPVSDYLHLLTAVTYIGHGVVLVNEDFAAQPILREFDKVIVPREEWYAANTIGNGQVVIIPAGYPKTELQLRERGFKVLPVPTSEFYKADGGVSCLSLLW